MYRKRLRSPAGCMRCKHRHTKCDEGRPRCSFCARHDLECIWPAPSQPRQKGNSQLAATASLRLSILGRKLARDNNEPKSGPFQRMPVHYSEDVSVIMHNLHGFFMGITQSILPFDVASSHEEMTRGWLASVYSDEAVCSSFVTYYAWFHSTRVTRQCHLITLSLKNEARSLALLRDRIAKNETVTEGTLLAAALHLFIATFTTEDPAQLSRIAQGIYALVTAKGGSNTIMRYVSPSTMRSLVLSDIFNSKLNAQKPFLKNDGLPPRPPSYDALFTRSPIDEAIATCVGQEVTDVLEDMRFALFFRAPSQQTRKLSSEESKYLFMLLQEINYALCAQQSRLVSSRSAAEIAIYGMILVKEEVLSDVVEHPIMPITILQRLRSAVSTFGSSLQGLNLTVALWASTMALVGTEWEVERTWALEFIIMVLDTRYGRSWPEDWTIQVRSDLQRVLWHDRIEVAFTTICTRVNRLRSHIVDHMTE